MKTFDVERLWAEIQSKWWGGEFDPKYFNFRLDKGRIYGSYYWSNRGDTMEVELRSATKYEITIKDTYDKLCSLFLLRGE